MAPRTAAAKPQPSTSGKKLTLQQQIEVLQKQVQDLDQEAIAELKAKLADAKKVFSTLEAELTILIGEPKARRTH